MYFECVQQKVSQDVQNKKGWLEQKWAKYKKWTDESGNHEVGLDPELGCDTVQSVKSVYLICWHVKFVPRLTAYGGANR